MSAPVVNSITFDKSVYNPGDRIVCTFNYTPGSSLTPTTQTLTGVGTDSTTGLTGNLQVTFTVTKSVSDATVVTATDSGGRTWTKQSDTGTVAVFNATA